MRNILAAVGSLKDLDKDEVNLKLQQCHLIALHIAHTCYTERPAYDQDYEDYINNIPISRK